MKSFLLASALVAVALLSACSQSDGKPKHVAPISPEYNATALAGQAKGEVIAIGTLSTFGSFEYGYDPLVTLAAASIKHVPQMLHDHQLTVDESQSLINAAVKVRSLLKRAYAVCKQNGAGKCTGNQAQAESLADESKTVIASSCLALTDKEILTCLHH
jgi:hypothetical protein